VSERPAPRVPRVLERAAAVAWRVLLVGAALVVLGLFLKKLTVLVLALFASLLTMTVLAPLAQWLRRRGWPKLAAAWGAYGAGLLVLIVAAVLVVPPFLAQVGDFSDAIREAIREARSWLRTGVLGLSPEVVQEAADEGAQNIRGQAGTLLGGVLAGTRVIVEVVVALVLAFVLTFFFLKDSDEITDAALGLVPPDRRDEFREIGSRVWTSVSGYVRGSAMIGLIDATLIGIGLILLGVPLALPLILLTFLGAFFPIVGAWTAGLAAAGIAAVTLGWQSGLIVAAISFGVQQVESNVLEPLVLGRTVDLHPAMILVVLTAGGILGGIFGALLAVPVSASIASVIAYYRGEPAPQKRKRASAAK